LIYHRKQSKQPEDVETARKQIAHQEIWGGPCRNNMAGDTPKVKAWRKELDWLNAFGIEFRTMVTPDPNGHPVLVYWSRYCEDREGVREEDGYAKIDVKIRFCNQFDRDYIADD
jgi:hypothetical protein